MMLLGNIDDIWYTIEIEESELVISYEKSINGSTMWNDTVRIRWL